MIFDKYTGKKKKGKQKETSWEEEEDKGWMAEGQERVMGVYITKMYYIHG